MSTAAVKTRPMNTKWTSNSLPAGESTGGVPPLGEQFVVLLMYGKNSFGDKIYSYLKITVANLGNLKAAIRAGNGFNPSDYGEVLAAGKGEPTPEVQAEM